MKQAVLHTRFTDSAAANADCIAQVSTFSICQSMLKTVPVLTCRLTLFCKYKFAAILLNLASHTHFPFSSLVLQVVLSFRGSCFLLAQRMQKPEREKALLGSTPKWSLQIKAIRISKVEMDLFHDLCLCMRVQSPPLLLVARSYLSRRCWRRMRWARRA